MNKSLLYIFLFFSLLISAQDDSEEQPDGSFLFGKDVLKKESDLLTFKSNFFEALTERNKENYDKALEYLTVCEKVYPDNVAMIFEKAKNHFALKQYVAALDYCDKGLTIAPDNYWLLDLQKEIYLKENNYEKAIACQKKMYRLKNQAAEGLLRLYYYSKNKTAGKVLLAEIEAKNISITAIDFYQKYFNNNLIKKNIEKQSGKPTNTKNIENLRQDFVNYKTFITLRNLLEKEKTLRKYKELMKDSEEGLVVFPAQAIVYWYNGIALQNLNKNKEAIEILETGLDFVVDDKILLKDFYRTLIKSYKAIGNQAKANQYKQMVQKLQNP